MCLAYLRGKLQRPEAHQSQQGEQCRFRGEFSFNLPNR